MDGDPRGAQQRFAMHHGNKRQPLFSSPHEQSAREPHEAHCKGPQQVTMHMNTRRYLYPRNICTQHPLDANKPLLAEEIDVTLMK